jgi:hypothetical protein
MATGNESIRDYAEQRLAVLREKGRE